MKAALTLFLAGLFPMSKANDTSISVVRKLTVKDICNTKDLTVEEMAEVDQAIASYRVQSMMSLGSTVEEIVIKVFWHQFKPSGGASESSNYEQSVAEKSIQILNDAFGGKEASYNECSGFTYQAFDATPFVFELEEYIEYENSAVFNLDSGTSKTYMENNRKGDCSTLNVFTGKTGYLGFASFPNSCPKNGDFTTVNNKSDSVKVSYGSLPDRKEYAGQYDEGDTLTHEVGHWMGLYHTFQEGCNGSGDSVSDTPPEASPHFGCQIGRDTCSGGGEDPIHNFMDYSDDCCMYRFSEKQISRMVDQAAIYRGLVQTTGLPTESPKTGLPTESPKTASPTESPKTASPSKSPKTSSPIKSPTSKLPTSSGPTTFNEAQPLSWNITMIPPATTTTNSEGEPVLQIRYEISNRDHFVNIYGPDCKTDVDSIFWLDFKDSPASTLGFLDLNVDVNVDKAKLEENEIWIPGTVGGSFSFCLSPALYIDAALDDEDIVTKKEIIFTVAVNNIASFDMEVETFIPIVEENNDLDINYSGTVEACQCDDNGCMDELSPDLGPFDILSLCVWEVNDENEVIVSSIKDLQVFQKSSDVTFNAIRDGAISGGNDELVVMDCTPSTGAVTQCNIQIQLISVFFSEIGGNAPGNLEVSGSAILGAAGSRSSLRVIDKPGFDITVGLQQEKGTRNVIGFVSSLLIMLPCM